jgi:hypothetical protein
VCFDSPFSKWSRLRAEGFKILRLEYSPPPLGKEEWENKFPNKTTERLYQKKLKNTNKKEHK